MADTGYLLRVIRHASFDKLKKTIDTVHQKSGKNRLLIFLDMAQCALRYGAGYYDYQVFEFYKMNDAHRKTFVTRLISKKLNMYLNDEATGHILDNKDEMYRLFKDYTHRDFLRIEDSPKEDVLRFISERKTIFCKLRDKECGIGCEKLNVSDFASAEDLYHYLVEKKINTIEDCIEQHPDVAVFHPGSVNSLRVITLIGSDHQAHCLYVVQKMGIGDSIIDNNCMFTRVDPETGVIHYPAHSGDTTLGIFYTEHPDTHIPLLSYRIPFVKEAVEMCKEAALLTPRIRYIGWDVAITPNGPCVIEANTYCAHDFWQLPPHTPDQIGMLPLIQSLLPEYQITRYSRKWMKEQEG